MMSSWESKIVPHSPGGKKTNKTIEYLPVPKKEPHTSHQKKFRHKVKIQARPIRNGKTFSILSELQIQSTPVFPYRRLIKTFFPAAHLLTTLSQDASSSKETQIHG